MHVLVLISILVIHVRINVAFYMDILICTMVITEAYWPPYTAHTCAGTLSYAIAIILFILA